MGKTGTLSFHMWDGLSLENQSLTDWDTEWTCEGDRQAVNEVLETK